MCETSKRRRADRPAGSPGSKYRRPGSAARAISASATRTPGSPRTTTAPSLTSRSSSAASRIRAASWTARSRTAVAAWCTALPPTTVDREAQDPAPNGWAAVSPVTTRTIPGSTPSASAAIWASTVSMPWPTEVPPEYTWTAPDLLTVTSAVSCGPRPLFSTNSARPKPRRAYGPGSRASS
jgi:hypothetical protein